MMSKLGLEVILAVFCLFQEGIAVLRDCELYGESNNIPVAAMCFDNTVTTNYFLLDTFRAKVAQNTNPCRCTATPSINAPVTLSFTAHIQPGWSGCGNVIIIQSDTQTLALNCYGSGSLQMQAGNNASFSLTKPDFSWDERFCIRVTADSAITMRCEGESLSPQTTTSKGTTTSQSTTTTTPSTTSTTSTTTTPSTTTTTTPSTTTTITTPSTTTAAPPTTMTTTKAPSTATTTQTSSTTMTTTTTTPKPSVSTTASSVTSSSGLSSTQSSQTTSSMSTSTSTIHPGSSTVLNITNTSATTPRPVTPTQRPTGPAEGNKGNQKDDSDVKLLPWQAIIPAVAAAFLILIAIVVACYIYYTRKETKSKPYEVAKPNAAYSHPYMAYNNGYTPEDEMTEMRENELYKSADDVENGNTRKPDPITSSPDDVQLLASSGDQTSGTFVRCSVVPPESSEQSFPAYAEVDRSSKRSQNAGNSLGNSGNTDNKVLY